MGSDIVGDKVLIRPEYCALCGGKLSEQPQITRYDRYTGAAKHIRYILKCPDWQAVDSPDPRESSNGHDLIYWPPDSFGAQSWWDAQQESVQRQTD